MITDRVWVVEEQAARLAALENSIHNPTLKSLLLEPTNQLTFSQLTPHSFNNVLISTGIVYTLQYNDSPPIRSSNINTSLSINMQSDIHNLNNLCSTSGITLDNTRIPIYDGNLSLMHPEEFIDKVDQYFLMHPVPDQVKINLISEKFVKRA